VKKLFYWRDPKVTGPVFLAGNVIFIATLFYKRTLLNIFSLACMWYLIVGFAVVNLSKLAVGFVGPDFVKKPELGKQYISRALVESKLDAFIQHGNKAIDEIKKAVYCVDNSATIRYIGIAFALIIVGRLFSDMLLLYLVFLAAFIGPIVYEKNQKEIDAKIAEGRQLADAKLAEGRKMADAKYGEFKKVAAEKTEVYRAQLSEKATPYLEKNAAARGIAEKVGLTPKKAQ